MVGRFIGSALLQMMNAGKLLGQAALAAAVLVGATVFLKGNVASFAIVSVGLFNSIMFPTIFTLAIRGLGPMAERASSLLIMAIVGGAVIPLAHGALADRAGLQLAFVLPFACYLYIAYFGFWARRLSPAAS
jgi:MFS transporter, FHS family, L-fucose permease